MIQNNEQNEFPKSIYNNQLLITFFFKRMPNTALHKKAFVSYYTITYHYGFIRNYGKYLHAVHFLC